MPDIPPAIVWFRNDLRAADNPALSAALDAGCPIIPLYIQDDCVGSAARWWLHHSLASLQKTLSRQNARLILRRGDPSRVIQDLIAKTGAKSVFWNRRYGGASIAQDTAIKQHLAENGITVTSFNGSLLQEPWDLRTKAGEPFSVFTPFWRTLRSIDVGGLIQAPGEIPGYEGHLASDRLEDWRLTPSKPDWSIGFPDPKTIGEAGAHGRLEEFLVDGLVDYAKDRDRPDLNLTSHLSPRLHWGELSPRQVWHAVETHRARSETSVETGAEKFLAELAWRDFSYHLLYRYPDIATKPIRAEFEKFPWNPDQGLLEAWQQGKTGYSLVDAGMRELWATGTMHNRVRMVVASFLTKHLLQSWQEGAAWFMDTLIDADLAANSANWQWVAGCGADAAPYFRIFNPILQAKKFDPHGDYVRRWVPDRKDLDTSTIHDPINPIVEHDTARRRALDALASLKASFG